MDQDALNMQIRKALKQFGVTSQQEIEHAVRRALESGELRGSEEVPLRMTLHVERLGVDHTIEGKLDLSGKS